MFSTPYIVPGQGFVNLTIYETAGKIASSGRAVKSAPKKTDKSFLGIVTNASQKEIEQWKQNGHPITHKITQYGCENVAKATDYLKSETGAEYKVQGRKNPAGLNVTMIYYVEERLDIKLPEDSNV